MRLNILSLGLCVFALVSQTSFSFAIIARDPRVTVSKIANNKFKSAFYHTAATGLLACGGYALRNYITTGLVSGNAEGVKLQDSCLLNTLKKAISEEKLVSFVNKLKEVADNKIYCSIAGLTALFLLKYILVARDNNEVINIYKDDLILDTSDSLYDRDSNVCYSSNCDKSSRERQRFSGV